VSIDAPSDDLYSLLSGGNRSRARSHSVILADRAVINRFKIRYVGPNMVKVEKNGTVWQYQLNE
jgi:hypothetical protein